MNKHYKKSGHLADQQLKYSKSNQTRIEFETTKAKIERNNIEIETVVEGIRLTATEIKIVDTLCRTLHEKSYNINNPNEDDFYSGEGKIMPYTLTYQYENVVVTEDSTAPRLMLDFYEFVKSYSGKKRPSGKEMKNVHEALLRLSEKSFLIKYTETHKRPDGSRTEYDLEMFDALINIPKIGKRDYSPEDKLLSSTQPIKIFLHPIFRRQIDSKFLLYPKDITKRTQIANGSNRVAKATLTLRDYLIRAMTFKSVKDNEFRYSVYAETLYNLLAGKEIDVRQYKRAEQKLIKAIDVCKNLKILLEHETTDKENGMKLHTFYLNKDWI